MDFKAISPEAIFGPFKLGNAEGILAAVSGGSDSLAMLLLLADYLKTSDTKIKLTAVTVDHKLRPESAYEAEQVTKICADHGIRHQILVWDDTKPASGIAEAARGARYRLLLQAAKPLGADVIVTGHTRNDQIETYLMRKERSHSADARGLAAMASTTLLEKTVRLIRPFLNTSREALRAELVQRRIGWFEDPSNENAAYERPRIRMKAATITDIDGILHDIGKAQLTRMSGNAAVVAALAEKTFLEVQPYGAIGIDAAKFNALDEPTRNLICGVISAVVSGRNFLPSDRERQRISDFLMGRGGANRFTMTGSLIQRASDGSSRHWFQRERRNLPKKVLLCGETIVWDGRYRVNNTSHADYIVRAPTRFELDKYLDDKNCKFEVAVKEGLLSAPAFFTEEKLTSIPVLETGKAPSGIEIEPYIALFDHVLTGHDFELAAALEITLELKHKKLCNFNP